MRGLVIQCFLLLSVRRETIEEYTKDMTARFENKREIYCVENRL